MAEKSIEELAAEARRAYFKEWRAKNKDKVKQHNANFWLKKAAQKKEKEADNVNQD